MFAVLLPRPIDRLDEQARPALARDHACARLAALHEQRVRIENQLPLGIIRVVAINAVLLKKRMDACVARICGSRLMIQENERAKDGNVFRHHNFSSRFSFA
jgi:hypothetical protein